MLNIVAFFWVVCELVSLAECERICLQWHLPAYVDLFRLFTSCCLCATLCVHAFVRVRVCESEREEQEKGSVERCCIVISIILAREGAMCGGPIKHIAGQTLSHSSVLLTSMLLLL